MKSIEETAFEKFPELTDSHKGFDYNMDARESYIEGANDVLNEILMTISVSNEGYLRDNLLKLVKKLKGNEDEKDN